MGRRQQPRRRKPFRSSTQDIGVSCHKPRKSCGGKLRSPAPTIMKSSWIGAMESCQNYKTASPGEGAFGGKVEIGFGDVVDHDAVTDVSRENHHPFAATELLVVFDCLQHGTDID